MSFLDFHLSIITPTNKILGKGQQIVEAAIHSFTPRNAAVWGVRYAHTSTFTIRGSPGA